MTDSTTPAAEAAPIGPRYLADTPRSVTIPLQHPFELNGVEVREVTVRRLRGFEAKHFAQASLLAAQAGRIEPMFPGIDISAEGYSALDDDDVYAIDEAVEVFLPARFRALGALAEKVQGSKEDDNSHTGDPLRA
ncbi:hypothetical protein [Devosia naphthalenivorans]|uniref:hypothetical protein n=1 Tax=Devosia naphthalenivorans TaxID=2082392 RepID=UPI0013B05986|nr:hypothetical protein [Devosia naphthalenivorans]